MTLLSTQTTHDNQSRQRRKFALVIMGLTMITSNFFSEASGATAKAGGKCLAAGQVTSVKRSNFVCVAKGAKLVWTAQKVGASSSKAAYTGTFTLTDAQGKATGTMFWGLRPGDKGVYYNDAILAFEYSNRDGSCTLSAPASKGAGPLAVSDNPVRFSIGLSFEGIAKCTNGSTAPVRMGIQSTAPGGLVSSLPFKTSYDVISKQDVSVGFTLNPDGAAGSFTTTDGNTLEFTLKAATADARPAGVSPATPSTGGG
jgi:hypothetical protein